MVKKSHHQLQSQRIRTLFSRHLGSNEHSWLQFPLYSVPRDQESQKAQDRLAQGARPVPLKILASIRMFPTSMCHLGVLFSWGSVAGSIGGSILQVKLSQKHFCNDCFVPPHFILWEDIIYRSTFSSSSSKFHPHFHPGALFSRIMKTLPGSSAAWRKKLPLALRSDRAELKPGGKGRV